MNHQYTLVPLNMDRIPLTNQDPNRHMVAGAPPFRKPPAGPTPGAAPRAPSAEPAQTNHRNRAHAQRAHRPRTGKMTLRYLHESTTSIHDRVSGWQGPPPSLKDREDEMKREAERLERILNRS